MENFIIWLSNNFISFISQLSGSTTYLINEVFADFGNEAFDLQMININLVLFSDTPILTLNAFDLSLLFFSVFYTVIFIVIVWKIIKKVVKKITGWNKW